MPMAERPLLPVAAVGTATASPGSRCTAVAEDAQDAQERSLKARGLLVRNTFIDCPAPCWEGSVVAARRAHSAPASLRPSVDDREWCHAVEPACLFRLRRSDLSEAREGSPTPSADFSSTSASTACSETDQFNTDCDLGAPCCMPRARATSASCESESFTTDLDLGEACKEPMRRLVELIESECGFFRIRSYGLRPESGERAKKWGVAATLRFYVHGLPWAKRAKWRDPLLWSAAAVLQRRGSEVRVQSGELLAPVAVGVVVLVDFVAART